MEDNGSCMMFYGELMLTMIIVSRCRGDVMKDDLMWGQSD